MPLDKALVEAGAIRMRPILMTTGTTVISMLPNAVAYGKSGAMMQGLALVDVGGLIAATILTLILLHTITDWSTIWDVRQLGKMCLWFLIKN